MCLEQSERGGEREEGRRGGQGGLGLLPPGGGSPGGLWAEGGRGLTQVLMGTL